MTSIRFANDDLVVNFHDACIYGRDLALLESPTAWLNDACIHWALTDLQVGLDQAGMNDKSQQQQHEPQQGNNGAPPTNPATTTDTLLLDPAVVAFLMHQCHDAEDFQDFRRGCRHLHGIARLVIPINDTLTSTDWAIPGSGTHWSLLVLERHGVDVGVDDDDNNNSHIHWTGYHFDSVANSGNRTVAQAVADKVILGSRGLADSSAAAASPRARTSPTVRACSTPAQRNGYDCGVHVIAAAQAVVDVIRTTTTTRLSPRDYEAALRRWYERTVAITGDEKNPCRSLRQELAARIRQLAGSDSGTTEK